MALLGSGWSLQGYLRAAGVRGGSASGVPCVNVGRQACITYSNGYEMGLRRVGEEMKDTPVDRIRFVRLAHCAFVQHVKQAWFLMGARGVLEGKAEPSFFGRPWGLEGGWF